MRGPHDWALGDTRASWAVARMKTLSTNQPTTFDEDEFYSTLRSDARTSSSARSPANQPTLPSGRQTARSVGRAGQNARMHCTLSLTASGLRRHDAVRTMRLAPALQPAPGRPLDDLFYSGNNVTYHTGRFQTNELSIYLSLILAIKCGASHRPDSAPSNPFTAPSHSIYPFCSP